MFQQNFFFNPKADKCKMSAQAKKSLQVCFQVKREPSDDKASNNTILFGGIAISTEEEITQPHQDIMRYGNLIKAQKVSTADKNPCLGSGATRNMFAHKEDAVSSSYKRGGSTTKVQTAVGSSIGTCVGTGTYQHNNLELKDALYVKNLNQTLISVGDVCDLGKIIVFTSKEALILNNSRVEIPSEQVFDIVPRTEDGLYKYISDEAKALMVRVIKTKGTLVQETGICK